ncbi:alpha/beta fold hydrolase, partial [Rhodoplanes roseus]|uniref:alpha/beta fold hydrolase n=1 Tax=Rhodoplanes roseus TaxID=29409 RepID=UPI000DAE94B6
ASTRDGTELFYRIDGRGPHRIALVHSLAADHAFWRPVVERLGEAATILTYDCRGHGTSGKPKGPYTVELFADDLADLFDAVQWQTAVVAGASMGGCVALAFAARHPQRTAGLGLIDTTAWYGADAPQQWAERAGKARTEGLGALVGFQKTRWFGDAFREQHPDVVEAAVATFVRNDVDAYVETCRMLGAADLRAALPGIRVPTRIVVGEEDYATPPAMAQVLHAGIAGSSCTVIDKGRHLTPLDNPDKIVAELRTLLEAAA